MSKMCPYCHAQMESVEAPDTCPSCHSVLKKPDGENQEAPSVAKAELIHWDERFLLGIDEVDKQHQRLCELINELFRAIRFNVYGANFIPRALLQLREYTLYHFKAEETLFGKAPYPNAQAHIKAHHDFVNWVQKLEANYKEALLDLKPILKFLVEWFIDHTQRIDREYVRFINTKELKK